MMIQFGVSGWYNNVLVLYWMCFKHPWHVNFNNLCSVQPNFYWAVISVWNFPLCPLNALCELQTGAESTACSGFVVLFMQTSPSKLFCLPLLQYLRNSPSNMYVIMVGFQIYSQSKIRTMVPMLWAKRIKSRILIFSWGSKIHNQEPG